MKVACIGSRRLKESELRFCFRIGEALAKQGITVSSGNATGADQAFGQGVNFVNPELLELHLPWPAYNEYAIKQGNKIVLQSQNLEYWNLAASVHPNWDNLIDSVRMLHTRNVSIVVGTAQVVAWPSAQGGGTMQGIRTAKRLNIAVVDLSNAQQRQLIENYLMELSKVRA